MNRSDLFRPNAPFFTDVISELAARAFIEAHPVKITNGDGIKDTGILFVDLLLSGEIDWKREEMEETSER